ncbi:MAG: zinc ribbon domain-containing protein [Dehalococcoidia bacterium]
MPLYEYFCADCKTTFELLRPMARAEERATCPGGHGRGTRVLSVFATMSKGPGGAQLPEASGGGCGCGGACSCGGH